LVFLPVPSDGSIINSALNVDSFFYVGSRAAAGPWTPLHLSEVDGEIRTKLICDSVEGFEDTRSPP
jgi:hypothetical protein